MKNSYFLVLFSLFFGYFAVFASEQEDISYQRYSELVDEMLTTPSQALISEFITDPNEEFERALSFENAIQVIQEMSQNDEGISVYLVDYLVAFLVARYGVSLAMVFLRLPAEVINEWGLGFNTLKKSLKQKDIETIISDPSVLPYMGYYLLSNEYKTKFVEYLLKNKKKMFFIDMEDSEEKTSFNYAIEQQKFELAYDLLVNSPDKDIAMSEALFIAADNSYERLVELLVLDENVDVNTEDSVGRTALMFAVAQNNLPIVQALLEAGADVDIQNNHGWTALMHAIRRDNLPIVQELINAGADVNIQNDIGATSLMYAVDKDNNLSVVQALLDAGADVRVQDDNRVTVLIRMIYLWGGEHTEYTMKYINLLLQASNNQLEGEARMIDLQGNDGKTALMYAVDGVNDLPVVKVLLDAGADVRLQDNHGITALMYAVLYNKISYVNALLQVQGNQPEGEALMVNMQDNDGNTALDHALSEDHTNIVNLLRKHIASLRTTAD